MLKNFIFTTFAILLGVLYSCKAPKQSQSSAKMTTTSSGLQYQIIAKGQGPAIQSGDKVTAHYIGKLSNDSVFDNSYTRNMPFSFKLGKGEVIKGWEEGFALLGKGDKAVLIVPPALAYGDKATGDIPPNSTLRFEVEVLDVTPGLRPYDVKGLDTVKTTSGLKYIMVSSNKEEVKASTGDKVKVHYTGYLLDGKIFDSSVERGTPFEFQLGKGMVIPGWDEAIALMHKNEKARLIIPSNLGYGDRPAGPIPPGSTLVFDVELVDVVKRVLPKPFEVSGKEVKKTDSGLQYIVVEKGKGGLKPIDGKTVVVHYTGYLTDGSVFDSSVERAQPIQFPIGEGRVIPGWEEGIRFMEIGDKYRFIIPPSLAYGENGYPPVIPPNATITFDVELILVYDTPSGNEHHGPHDGHNH